MPDRPNARSGYALLDAWADVGGVVVTIGLRSGQRVRGILRRHDDLNVASREPLWESASGGSAMECFSVEPVVDFNEPGDPVYFSRSSVETIA